MLKMTIVLSKNIADKDEGMRIIEVVKSTIAERLDVLMNSQIDDVIAYDSVAEPPA